MCNQDINPGSQGKLGNNFFQVHLSRREQTSELCFGVAGRCFLEKLGPVNARNGQEESTNLWEKCTKPVADRRLCITNQAQGLPLVLCIFCTAILDNQWYCIHYSCNGQPCVQQSMHLSFYIMLLNICNVFILLRLGPKKKHLTI